MILREVTLCVNEMTFMGRRFSFSKIGQNHIIYSGDDNSNAGQENDDLDQVDAAEADAMGMMDTGDLDAEMAAADMGGNDY